MNWSRSPGSTRWFEDIKILIFFLPNSAHVKLRGRGEKRCLLTQKELNWVYKTWSHLHWNHWKSIIDLKWSHWKTKSLSYLRINEKHGRHHSQMSICKIHIDFNTAMSHPTVNSQKGRARRGLVRSTRIPCVISASFLSPSLVISATFAQPVLKQAFQNNPQILGSAFLLENLSQCLIVIFFAAI